ncbi:MAG: KR domain-containing protein, partial [Saccharothrix sp.]|nr:KR domain-containing protein [Saccharothrix sp.]
SASASPVLHGAAVNEPRPLAAITRDTLAATVAPKVLGLRALLDAVGERLALLVGFGSIIGRRGLPGQAEYCVANDWLRADLERWAAAHPTCRTRAVEWSVWSEVGMGERMGVLHSLRDQGIAPVEPAAGAAALLAALADPDAPVTQLVAGRFPDGPTLSVHGPIAEPLRFSADLLVRVPGVEAVLAPVVSTGSDPYLDDHRVDGVPVLPAVIGLEAMAQAAASAVGERETWEFTDVELPAPVVVNPYEPRALRVAALARDEAEPAVDVVLRDGSDGFAADRLRAVVKPAPPAPRGAAVTTTPPGRAGPHPFYGPLLFHSGRMRGLVDYEHLSAFRVRAWVRAGREPWFAEHHAPRLLLGDPGVHDAAIHVLLACLPHRRALPVSAERMTVWRRPEGLVLVSAEERSHHGDDYVYDVCLSDQDGACLARWDGLTLRAYGARSWPEPLPVPLIGPLLSRRLAELGFADRVELVSTEDGLVAHGPAGVGCADDAPTAVTRALLDLGLPGDAEPTAGWTADRFLVGAPAEAVDRPADGFSAGGTAGEAVAERTADRLPVGAPTEVADRPADGFRVDGTAGEPVADLAADRLPVGATAEAVDRPADGFPVGGTAGEPVAERTADGLLVYGTAAARVVAFTGTRSVAVAVAREV